MSRQYMYGDFEEYYEVQMDLAVSGDVWACIRTFETPGDAYDFMETLNTKNQLRYVRVSKTIHSNRW